MSNKNILFLENIGRASTSAWLNNKCLGRNVNACAYIDNTTQEIIVKLESNGGAVKGVSHVRYKDLDAYNEWKDEKPNGLHMMLWGLRLFNCETSFD